MGDRRSPLWELPLLPHALPMPQGLRRRILASQVWLWVNETALALRALHVGAVIDCFAGAKVVSRRELKLGWSKATLAQKEVLRLLWQAVALWLSEVVLPSASAALERVLRAVPADFRSGRGDTRPGELARGDLCPLVVDEVSLPDQSSQPVRIEQVFAGSAEFFGNMGSVMLRAAEEVDWDEYYSIKPYMAPELKNKNVLLDLLLRLWSSNMLGLCDHVEEEVSVFTVLKKSEAGRRSSRLVWDLRSANLRWKTPPWVPLGSPISLACLDLSEQLLEGRKLVTCQGDLPDFFYTLELPPAFLPWFVFAGASTDDLLRHARRRGRDLDLPSGKRLALRVLGMGWSWAVFLAHSCLQAIFEEGVADIDPLSQLIDGMPTPQFDRFQKLFWLYIDDFAVAELEDPTVPESELPARETLRRCKEAIVSAGLKVHKDRVGFALPASLGVEISARNELRSLTEKQGLIAQATRALVARGRCSSKEVEVLLGSWVWIMMTSRCCLSVCVEVYRFVRDFEGLPARKMPAGVAAELSTLVALLPLMKVELDASWHRWAYMVDASLEGFGAVATASTHQELREEARWCERRGWTVQLERTYTDLEELSVIDRRAVTGGARVVGSRRGGGSFLELFAGSGRLSEAVQRCFQTKVEKWDLCYGAEFDLSDPARLADLVRRIKSGSFWFVHLAPPCSTFSRARRPPLRSLASMWGLPSLTEEEKRRVDEGTYLCLVAVELARELHAAKVPFSLENPEGSLMWRFPPVCRLEEDLRLHRIGLDYCMFGTDWKKPTRFLTSFGPLRALQRRCDHSSGHQLLRGVSPTGELWTKVACAYPEELCRCFAECLAEAGLPRRSPGLSPPSWEPAPVMGQNWQVLARWHLLYQGVWKEPEHNNILEARTALGLVRRLAMGDFNPRKVLMFTDSLVALGIFSKGRSSVHVLNRLCRGLAATMLAFRIRPLWRWVPSELNFSDGPSRGEGVGVAVETAAAHRYRGLRGGWNAVLRHRVTASASPRL